QRHLRAAEVLGADCSGAKDEDAGTILADRIVSLMRQLGAPNGLSALGYGNQHIPALVEGTLPQHRVTKLSPRAADAEELAGIFEDALSYW
ncbi:MAG: iron-containing alcohol dehydrogenase, partial [Gemmatimonadetes bacterium]|nr:iron-containing alcohol dehydrogenase [Gemmatimonadota bacterium]